MAASTLGDLATTTTWADVIVTYASAASVPVMIQNTGAHPVGVQFGGTSAAANTNGVILERYDSVSGDAAHIWVKSLVPQASVVSVTAL